jgi:hypothetical protein
LCLFVLASSLAIKSSCPNGGTTSTYNSTWCWLYVDKKFTADGAEDFCNKTYQWQAASINDGFENKAISGNLNITMDVARGGL